MSGNGKAALRQAIKVLGSQKAAAGVVGCVQSAVSECLRNGKAVPAGWCIPLERATEEAGEKVSRHDLNPEIYPVETEAAA